MDISNNNGALFENDLSKPSLKRCHLKQSIIFIKVYDLSGELQFLMIDNLFITSPVRSLG